MNINRTDQKTFEMNGKDTVALIIYVSYVRTYVYSLEFMNITSKIYLTPIGQIAIVPHQYRYRTIPLTDFSRYRYGTGTVLEY